MDFSTFVLLFSGLIVLIVGGNLLLKSAVSISLKFNIPKILIGMTIVSLATSAPELIISLKSALIGSPDLAISNVVGSNIANIGLVLGLTILFSPIKISKNIYKIPSIQQLVRSTKKISHESSTSSFEGTIKCKK